MAFQAVPDGVEIVFNASQNSVPVVNVFHIKDTSVLDEERLTDIGELFIDWWRDQMQPIQANSYVLNNVTVTALEDATGPQVVLSLTSDNQGDVAGEGVPANAAAVISWRTASIGRSYRGRTYVGGLPVAAELNAQHITSTFQAALVAAGADLIDRLNTISAALSVLSRIAAGVLRVTGVLTQITSIIVDNVIDSQRKRTAN